MLGILNASWPVLISLSIHKREKNALKETGVAGRRKSVFRMVLWVPDCSTGGESGGEREKQCYSILLS